MSCVLLVAEPSAFGAGCRRQGFFVAGWVLRKYRMLFLGGGFSKVVPPSHGWRPRAPGMARAGVAPSGMTA